MNTIIYSLDRVGQIKLQRFRLLNELYKLSNANPNIDIPVTHFGIDSLSAYKNPVLTYLEKEGLIEVPIWNLTLAAGYSEKGIRITHEGIKEIESATENPLTPTAHFPANVFNFSGNFSNSQFQAAGNNATQTSTISQNPQELLDIIEEIKKITTTLKKDSKDELNAEVKTIEAQISSPKPKSTIIKEALSSTKSILENVSTTIAAAAPIITRISTWLSTGS